MLKSPVVFRFSLCLGAVLVGTAAAAPIRVLIFNTCGPYDYVHPITQQTPLVKAMLLNPAGAGLGNPVLPPQGFTVDSIGSALLNGNLQSGHALVQALPRYDVLVCLNNSSFELMFGAEDRAAFLAWARAKGHGIVAIHAALMGRGDWPEQEAYFGGRYVGWSEASAQVLADTTPGNASDPDFLALNAGLDAQNMVSDEWMSFRAQPRSLPGLRVLTTVNEASYLDNFPMKDHPISWYRAPADSGRFFYAGAGHYVALYKENYWFRRQLYNGILWASGYTGSGPVSARRGVTGPAANGQGFRMEFSGSALIVSADRQGPYSLFVSGLDGKVKARASGWGAGTHVISSLEPNAVYLVVITTPEGILRRLLQPR